MKRIGVVIAALMVGAAAPAPPLANYWMDVSTQSGMGAGLMGGGSPNMQQIMQMMEGGGGQPQHMLNLYLQSKQKAPSPHADHLIPPGLQMGPSLPLQAPAAAKPSPKHESMPGNFEQPKGRMLIYWGCGEHAGAGQPTVIDFSKLAAGQMPPGYKAMVAAIQAAQPPRPGQSASYGGWPNEKDSRAVPAAGSLMGAHKVEANYAPPIAFTLSQGQDFMPGLALREAGALPSGAIPLAWTPAPLATGYALSMFGGSPGGDVVMWSSASKAAAFPNMDYLSPGQVKGQVASGAILAPAIDRCTIPAEVVKASPTGMVMMIGYGPEAHFSDKPKSPTWTVRARYKTTASLMLGMGGMMGQSDGPAMQPANQQQQQRPKKKRFGIGDLIKQAIPGQ